MCKHMHTPTHTTCSSFCVAHAMVIAVNCHLCCCCCHMSLIYDVKPAHKSSNSLVTADIFTVHFSHGGLVTHHFCLNFFHWCANQIALPPQRVRKDGINIRPDMNYCSGYSPFTLPTALMTGLTLWSGFHISILCNYFVNVYRMSLFSDGNIQAFSITARFWIALFCLLACPSVSCGLFSSLVQTLPM